MKGFMIEQFHNKTENEKGISYSLDFETQHIGLYYRKKGAVCGKHYHKGKSPARIPEHGILLQGKIEFFCKDIKTGEEAREIIEAPGEWKIDPFIYHEAKILEEAIFIERKDAKDSEDYFFDYKWEGV